MKKYVDGEYIEMTSEEQSEFEASTSNVLTPTLEDRMTAAENVILDMLMNSL